MLKWEMGGEMKRVLSGKQRDMLANFSLNMAAISLGVAAFEGNFLGFISAGALFGLFFVFTREA